MLRAPFSKALLSFCKVDTTVSCSLVSIHSKTHTLGGRFGYFCFFPLRGRKGGVQDPWRGSCFDWKSQEGGGVLLKEGGGRGTEGACGDFGEGGGG